MDSARSSRIALIVGGGVAALVAGLIIARSLSGGHGGAPASPPPASQGGLVIDSSASLDTKVAPTKPLRCFVAGQLVGEFTLAECAKRNGVATDALDVGVDPTGALAAAPQAGTVLAPLPPREAVKAEPKVETAGAGPVGACWRYEGGWRKLNGDMSLAACTQTLFSGRCEKPGQALYGRWAQQTVRLVPGKIEISSDNHSFRTLSELPGSCG